MLFDLEFQKAAWDEGGVGQMALDKFITLANINDFDLLALIQPMLEVVCADFFNLTLGELDQLVPI
jgi:hypothetical protein